MGFCKEASKFGIDSMEFCKEVCSNSAWILCAQYCPFFAFAFDERNEPKIITFWFSPELICENCCTQRGFTEAVGSSNAPENCLEKKRIQLSSRSVWHDFIHTCISEASACDIGSESYHACSRLASLVQRSCGKKERRGGRKVFFCLSWAPPPLLNLPSHREAVVSAKLQSCFKR